MSSDSAETVGLSARIRRLAEIVEQVESEGTTVVDVGTDIHLHTQEFTATLDLRIGEGPTSPQITAEGEDATSPDRLAWTLENGDDAEMADLDEELQDVEVDADEIIADLEEDLEDGVEDDGDQDDDQSPVGEREVAPDVNEDVVDAVEDATEDEEKEDEEDDSTEYQAAADLQDALDESGSDEDDDLPEEDSLAADVLSALRDEGELSGPELKTVTESRSEIYGAISELEEADLVEKRSDPNDGRRTLYSAADWLVDGDESEGPDPTTVLVETPVPDRVSLEKALDAVAASNTVYDAAQTLDIAPNGLEEFCQRLDLKADGNRVLATDVEERVEELRQEVDDE